MNYTNKRTYSRVPRDGGDSNRGGSAPRGRSKDSESSRSGAGELTWKKMDLHLHTPASSDYRDPGISYLDILKKAEEKKLDMIAFADHNSIGGYAAMHREIETLTLLEKLNRITDQERTTLNEYRRLLGAIVVLPAFEFTATFGFHILGVFPENTSVRKLEYLLLDLNVPEDKMVVGAPDVGSTSDVMRAYAAITAAGGLAIAAHANSSNGVAMQGFPFGGQTKIAYTQDPNLAALEVTDLESTGRRTTAAFFNGSKPEYPRRMHLMQGSDAHSLETEQSDSANKRLGVGARPTEILVRQASFAALKEILMGNDFTRMRPSRSVSAWDFAERARSEGPNIVQSFHERAMTKTSRTRPILHDIVAFANAQGGTVYLGVNPDTRVAIHGVERADEDVRLLKADVQQTIEPPLNVGFDVKSSGNRAVILIKVPEGKETPYVYTPTGQIYVRAEDETAIAGRDEIISLVLKSVDAGGAKPTATRAKASAPAMALPRPLPEAAEAEPKATPVPTVPQQGRWAREARPEAETRRAFSPAAESATQERAYRPPAFPNLPPEKIKGKVQPAGSPAASQGGDTDRLTWDDTESERVTTPLTTEQVEEYLEDATNATIELVKPKGRRSPRSKAQSPKPEAEAKVEAAPEVAETSKRGRGRSRKAAGTEAQMEATVSSEHMSREELVAESEAAKPKRGRRSRKAEQLEMTAPTAAAAASPTGTEALLTEAEIEPGPQQAYEVQGPKPKAQSRGGRGSRRKGAAEVTASEQPAALVAEPAPAAETGKKTRRGGKKASAAQLPPAEPPSTGVEIISTDTRGTTRYHTMRDLRNQTTVHNVTRHSARRLWHYAILQHEHGDPAMSEVMWHPDLPIGLWRRGERAGAMRYDVAVREPDGKLSVYYGVTEEGLQGPWRDLIEMAEDAGYEGPDSVGG